MPKRLPKTPKNFYSANLMANLKMGRTVTTQKIFVASLYAAALVVIGLCSRVQAQMLLWDQVVSKAKKEGKVVVSIPPGAELRKSLKEIFEKRFAIELELVTGRGAAVAKKISDEFRAGLRLTDVHTGGSAPIIYGLSRHVRASRKPIHSSGSERSQALVGRPHVRR